MSTDVIYDANSLYARGWHAAQAQPDIHLDDSEGRPIGAILAGLKVVLSLMDDDSNRLPERVDRMLFCWDGKSKTDKGREPKPSAYYEEMDHFKEVMTTLFHAAHAGSASAEADDAVATAAYRSEKQGNTVYVVSGDKDLQQLQGGKIGYFCLNKKTLLSRAAILERWKVKRPSQIAIALAILGDKLDNIEGINGYGPKKVEKLFEMG